MVCNAGEDEPGSFKDRVLLESSPHLILEGMILGAYAIGATRAYLYLNETYKNSNDRMSEAISEASAAGYLGENILGSNFALDVVVHPAPTVYVAGEDSAALEVLEGRDAKPREKPPYPAVAGLFGMPDQNRGAGSARDRPRRQLIRKPAAQSPDCRVRPASGN